MKNLSIEECGALMTLSLGENALIIITTVGLMSLAFGLGISFGRLSK